MQRAECLLPFVVRNFSCHDYTWHNPDLAQIQIDERKISFAEVQNSPQRQEMTNSFTYPAVLLALVLVLVLVVVVVKRRSRSLHRNPKTRNTAQFKVILNNRGKMNTPMKSPISCSTRPCSSLEKGRWPLRIFTLPIYTKRPWVKSER